MEFNMRGISAIVAELFSPTPQYNKVKNRSADGRRFNRTNWRKPHQSAREKMRRVAQGKAGTCYVHGGQYNTVDGYAKRLAAMDLNWDSLV